MPNSLPYELRGKRVWVAGHRGMVGAALMRRLAAEQCEIITATRQELDLCRQGDVEAWVAERRPQAVFLAAATVGGILANDTYPADFLYDNLAMETNIIHAAKLAGVEKLLFLWLVLHLSAHGAAADPRGRAADRPAGAHQSVVRHRQDRRHHDVPSLSSPISLRLHLGNADESSTARTTITIWSRAMWRLPCW